MFKPSAERCFSRERVSIWILGMKMPLEEVHVCSVQFTVHLVGATDIFFFPKHNR